MFILALMVKVCAFKTIGILAKGSIICCSEIVKGLEMLECSFGIIFLFHVV